MKALSASLLAALLLLPAPLLVSCNSSGTAGNQATNITGRTGVLPGRRLIARLRNDSAKPPTTTPQGAPVDLVMLDTSTTTTAHVGDALHVELHANTGTGFQWMFVGCDDRPTDASLSTANGPVVLTPLFDLKKGEGTVRPTDAGKPGAPAHWVFEFTAAHAGTSTMQFVLVRPWEKGTKPADSRTLQVTVSGN